METHTCNPPSSRRDLPLAMVLGLVVTAVLFTLMALAQMLGEVKVPEHVYDEQLVAYTPPELEELEEEVVEETEQEPEAIELDDKEPPQLSLDQLDVALNPGTGGDLSSADLSVPDFSVGTQELSLDFINFRDLDNQPRPTRQVAPVYPAALRNQNTEGQVVIRFRIDKEGNVVDATVRRSSHPGFEQPAVAAVMKWKFEPGMKDGEAVPFTMDAPINFNLDR